MRRRSKKYSNKYETQYAFSRIPKDAYKKFRCYNFLENDTNMPMPENYSNKSLTKKK